MIHSLTSFLNQHSTRAFACLAFLLVCCCNLQAAQLPKHVELGLRAIDTIKKGNNTYGSPTKLVIQGVNGSQTENKAQCAPFVTHLLNLSYNFDDAYFKSWSNSNSPSPIKYFDAVLAGTAFSQVSRLKDIKPGDLIVMKYLAGYSNATNDMGHIMVVLAPPEPMPAVKPFVTATEQYQILIMDSTKSPHGAGDSRVGGSEQGLGKGYFRLYANRSGEIVGYSWSRSNGSAFYGPNQRPLIIGRLKNLP